jgi:hypothetical protein
MKPGVPLATMAEKAMLGGHHHRVDSAGFGPAQPLREPGEGLLDQGVIDEEDTPPRSRKRWNHQRKLDT